MTIPANTVRVSLLGHLLTSEIFNTSFWLQDTTITSNADAAALASAINTAMNFAGGTFPVDALNTTSGYDTVRVYCYPTGGPIASFIGDHVITGGTGAGVAINLPLQVAVVATLQTASAGRRNRGRMYFPCPTLAMTAGQLTLSYVAASATRLANIFTAINALSTVGSVSVVSQVGAGHTTPVNAVKIDSKLDIQRRRAGHVVAVASSSQGVV